ncbi:hypothetical protein [Nocardioides sp.]|uniref:hypothetical protein n=1 Tax=Nocardioides sp. TaxID=35761 RepID=UPI0037844101
MFRRTVGARTGTRQRARRALAVLAALGAVTASLALSAPAAEASVIPKQGPYHGVDHAGRAVSFTFAGNQMTHFTVGGYTIGGAHVSNGMWHETCHNGYCTKGSWTSDGHVSGYWRHGSGHWVHWTAGHQAPTAYHGPYMGNDNHGTRIHFRFSGSHVTTFEVGHTSYGNFGVSGGRFSGCQHGICVQGHWQDDYTVAGSWRRHDSSHWIGWTAHAYAS